MTFIIYYLIPILVVSKLLDLMRVQNLDMKFKYKFQNLRHDLHMLIVDEKVDPSHPAIPILDSKIRDGANNNNFNINVWLILYFVVKSRFGKTPQEETTSTRSSFLNKRQFKGSEELRIIFEKYENLPVQYLKAKSPVLIIIGALVYRVSKALGTKLNMTSFNTAVYRYINLSEHTNRFRMG